MWKEKRSEMKLRYKLHWASNQDLSSKLKWQIWDWTIRAPIAYLESRVIGRQICALLNLHQRAGSTITKAKSKASRLNGLKGGRPKLKQD